jgi:hypothetical protein
VRRKRWRTVKIRSREGHCEASIACQAAAACQDSQFYATQPLEFVRNRKLMEATFEAINAEVQLRFSTDYPHWDFDLPLTVYDLPFLSEAVTPRSCSASSCGSTTGTASRCLRADAAALVSALRRDRPRF